MYRDDLRYDSRLTECLAYGHKSVEWRFSTTRRAWCSRCSRTWPIEWLRLLSMAHIEPIEVTFATISDRCRRPDVRSREEPTVHGLRHSPHIQVGAAGGARLQHPCELYVGPLG